MLKKIKNVVKKLIASLKAKNLKDLSIAILVLSLVFVGWRTYSLWQQSRKDKATITDGEKEKGEKQKIIDGLNLLIKSLATDIANRDKTIEAQLIVIAQKEEEKKKIEKDAKDFKAQLKKSSQEEKDRILETLLENHKIVARVVAKQNYMEIDAPNRETLSFLVIDYDKFFKKDGINEEFILPGLNLSVGQLMKNEKDLKIQLELQERRCTEEKGQIQIDLDNMTTERNNYKKKNFWSRVGGVAAVVLTILILK